MKKTVFILFGLIVISSGVADSAMADAFTIHLYYNVKTKTLNFDNLSQNVVHDKDKDISIVEFAQQTTQGAYVLELYDSQNEKIASTEFSKQRGSFSLVIPYFSLATSIKIFSKETGTVIAEADISSLSTCNGNGICEYEKNETQDSCLGDCATSNVKYSSQTQLALNAGNGVIRDDKDTIVLKGPSAQSVNNPEQSAVVSNVPTKSLNFTFILYLVLVLSVIGAISVIIYRKVKKRDF